MNKNLILIFLLIFLFFSQSKKIENMENSKDVNYYLDAACQSCLNGSECNSKQLGNCTYICRLGTVTDDEFMDHINDNVCYYENKDKKNEIKEEIKKKYLDSEKNTAELKRLRDLLSN